MEDEPGRLQSTVSPRVIHDLVTNTLHIEVYTYVYAFKCYVDVKDKYKNTCKVIFSVCVYFIYIYIYISIPVQFSRSVVSNILQPHGLQHARPPCPPPTPGVYPNSCPLSR